MGISILVIFPQMLGPFGEEIAPPPPALESPAAVPAGNPQARRQFWDAETGLRKLGNKDY